MWLKVPLLVASLVSTAVASSLEERRLQIRQKQSKIYQALLRNRHYSQPDDSRRLQIRDVRLRRRLQAGADEDDAATEDDTADAGPSIGAPGVPEDDAEDADDGGTPKKTKKKGSGSSTKKRGSKPRNPPADEEEQEDTDEDADTTPARVKKPDPDEDDGTMTDDSNAEEDDEAESGEGDSESESDTVVIRAPKGGSSNSFRKGGTGKKDPGDGNKDPLAPTLDTRDNRRYSDQVAMPNGQTIAIDVPSP